MLYFVKYLKGYMLYKCEKQLNKISKIFNENIFLYLLPFAKLYSKTDSHQNLMIKSQL